MIGRDEKLDVPLGIVSAMYAFRHEEHIYFHLSFGRVIDHLAARYRQVHICVPISDGPPSSSRDYRLKAENVQIIPQPFYTSSLGGLKHIFGICRAYARTFRQCGHVFVRGMLPYVGLFYLLASLFGRRPCHWIVGNPVALLKTHRRSGYISDALAMVYALQDRWLTKLGRRVSGGSFICNGQELADIYRSPRTLAAISSTITADEFFERSDTCVQEVVKILVVCFVRPEKGLEYLIDALGQLRIDRPWELSIVGPSDQFPAYRSMLDGLIERHGLIDRIKWEGYVPYGPEMWRHLRQSDLFVLPTLSEGTPRVLVEARANSLPIVATNVGGIPSSVTDGVDGLLVLPKDSAALASSIGRIIKDGDLRRSLIRSGLASARRMTVGAFANLAISTMNM